MKTCKDCVHIDVCFAKQLGTGECAEICRDYKNKADFVEVVRCRECANRNKSKCPNRHFSDISGEAEDYTEDNDFCSYGEKRSDT